MSDFVLRMQADTQRWGPIIKASGFTVLYAPGSPSRRHSPSGPCPPSALVRQIQLWNYRALRRRTASVFLSCAEFFERIERSIDLLTFTGILVNLGKPIHHCDILGTNLVPEVVRLFGELFKPPGVLFLFRLRYLLFELLDIAIKLYFDFIVSDDLDDFLNLLQCWLRGV